MHAQRLLGVLATLMLCIGTLSAETYTVGVESIDYFPHYTCRDGDYSGFGRAVLDAFAAKAGITFTYKPLPVQRLFKTYLETDDLDFKYPDNSYWQGDMKEGKNVTYSEPVVAYIDGVLVLPENKGKGVDELKSLAIPRGFTAWTYLDRIESKQIRLFELADSTAMVKMTLTGRASGAYGGVAVIKQLLRDLGDGEDALVFDPDLPHTSSHFFLSSRQHPEVLTAFNAFLKDEAAAIDKLKAEYKVGIE